MVTDDLLSERAKHEVPLVQPRMGYDEMALQVVERAPVFGCPGVESLVVVEDDVEVDGSWAVAYRGYSANNLLNLFEQTKKSNRRQVCLDLGKRARQEYPARV